MSGLRACAPCRPVFGAASMRYPLVRTDLYEPNPAWGRVRRPANDAAVGGEVVSRIRAASGQHRQMISTCKGWGIFTDVLARGGPTSLGTWHQPRDIAAKAYTQRFRHAQRIVRTITPAGLGPGEDEHAVSVLSASR